MNLEFESLLAPAAESPPCGPDLAHDAAYLEFERLAQGKPERAIGATVVPAEDPPWPELLARGRELLGRTKDLRIAVTLVRALVHTEGYPGLVAGLHLVRRLLEGYWEGLHPVLDAEDDDDPTMRLNALAPLAHPLVLLRDLRQVPLVRSRQHGQLLVRDLEIALGKLPVPAGTKPLSPAAVETVLGAAATEDPAAIGSAAGALAEAKALVALLEDKVGPASVPDLKPLLATLHTVAQACTKFDTVVAAASPPPGPAAAAEAPPPAGAGAAAPPALPVPLSAADAEIRSRQDALLLIDKVVQYLELNEPTNPAPLLLRRGKRFMTMSFVDIVKEISPDSMARIDVIAGPAQKET